MKKLIVALILGLAFGYHWGYGDATDGKPTVAARALDRFGAAKIKEAQAAEDRRVDQALQP